MPDKPAGVVSAFNVRLLSMVDDDEGPGIYRADGILIAMRLPDLLEIDPYFRIRRVEPAESERVKKMLIADLKSQPPPGVAWLSSTPGHLDLTTNHLIEFRREGESREAALGDLQDKYVIPLVSALGAMTGVPAFAEVCRWGKESITGSTSMWSRTATMRNYGQIPAMEGTEQERLTRLLPAVRADRVAALAAKDLAAAQRMACLHGGEEAGGEATILRYFLVVERISRKVGKDKPPVPEREAQEQRIAQGLSRSLAKRGSAQQHARQITNASRELAKVDARHLRDLIAWSLPALGISEPALETALELTELRNRKLGHPGGGTGHLGGWIPKAERIAMDVFASYVATLA